MERKPITLYIDCFKKKPNNLYYKKIICRRKQLKCNSYSINKSKEKSMVNSNSTLNNRANNIINIRKYQTGKDNKEINNSYNKSYNISFYSTMNTISNKKQFGKIVKLKYNMNSVILLQKFIRGFIVRKKIKKSKNLEKNMFIANTANSKRFEKKINMNIFEAIKKNSRKQKNSIKLANNKCNERNSMLSGSKSPWNCKNIIFISKKRPKNIKSYSYDYKKNDDNDNKNLFETDISEIPNFKKSIIKNNIINNNNCNNNINKDINDNKNKDKTDNNNSNKKENLGCIPEIELSMSHFFNEQLPQNIDLDNTVKKINNDSINDKIMNNINININKEILEKHKRNNTEVESSIFCNNKNKKNLISPDHKNPSHVSTYQTKENTNSDRNVTMENNNNFFNLDSPQNKNTRRTAKAVLDSENNDDNKKQTKKLKNNILDTSIDHYLKDEFENDANYIKNKKNFNLVNMKNKYNFNPMINNKIKLRANNNDKKNISNNNNNNINDGGRRNTSNRCSLHVTNNNNIDILNKNKNKNKKLCDIIKEEKCTDIDKQTDYDYNDLKSIKSSFYDDEEFVIINYDYTLNDKKKENNLKITNVENININGRKNKLNDFITTLKKNINKNIWRYAYDLLKKIFFKNHNENNNDNESEKSMTMNDSISMVPEGRIEKNNIVFNYAQNEMSYNNSNINSNFNSNFNSNNTSNHKIISNSNSNTNSHKILENF